MLEVMADVLARATERSTVKAVMTEDCASNMLTIWPRLTPLTMTERFVSELISRLPLASTSTRASSCAHARKLGCTRRSDNTHTSEHRPRMLLA